MVNRYHVYISGRVQGVFFRNTTKKKAKELGINGWVKNLDDGRVEAVFEGDEEKLNEMLDFCEEGPRLARVDDVEVSSEEPENIDGFEVIR